MSIFLTLIYINYTIKNLYYTCELIRCKFAHTNISLKNMQKNSWNLKGKHDSYNNFPEKLKVE